MVQQRVAFARRAVAGHRLALGRRLQEKGEQVALDAQHVAGEAVVAGRRVQANRFFRREHGLHSLRRLARRVGGHRVDPERTTVRAQLLDIDNAQAARFQCAPRRQQRQVGEVLVIDRVVLPPLDQPKQVRELKRHRPRVLHQRPQPGRESANVRHVREDVVGGDQVRLAVLGRYRGARIRAEEFHHGPDALSDGGLGDVAGRLDPEHRDAGRREMLEQVAVVARDLGHQAVGGKPELGRHLAGVPLSVRDPRIGVRREVRVLGEDVLARHVRGKLDEQALFAQQHVQRVEDLGRVHALRREITLAERRHAEIDEGAVKARAA